MENAIRARRAHFSLLFCWKSDLGLSWRHLRSILGRLGKSFGPSWAPKTPPRCATWAPRRPQDATKTYPRAAQNTSQDALGSPRPPRTSKTLKMTPKSRWGTPRGLVFGAYMGAFGVGFWRIFYWFLVRSGPPFHRYFDWIFPRVFQEQSWDEDFFLENRGRDPRAFFRHNAVNFGDFWMTGHRSSAVAGTPRSGALVNIIEYNIILHNII